MPARHLSEPDAEGGDLRDSQGSSLQAPCMSQGFPFTQQCGTELDKANAVGKHVKASNYRGLMWSPS